MLKKPKILIFRDGGKIRSDEERFLNGDNISIVDKFINVPKDAYKSQRGDK